MEKNTNPKTLETINSEFEAGISDSNLDLTAVFESKRINLSKKFDDLKFTDDFMFCTTLINNPELCKELAELIIGKKISRIITVRNQKEIRPTPDGKGVRFDVFLEGEDEICDIEMQNQVDMDILPKRARYYQSVMDVDDLTKGATYQKLKKSYILFICKDSPFKDKGLHKFTFKNLCVEDPTISLGDETEKIFLTPKGDAGDMSPEMEALMTYVADNKTASDFTRRLDEAIEAIKNGEGWRIEYMQLKEKLDMNYDAGLEEGEKKGIEKTKRETALVMLQKGKLSNQDIAEYTGLTISDVEKLAKNLKQ